MRFNSTCNSTSSSCAILPKCTPKLTNKFLCIVTCISLFLGLHPTYSQIDTTRREFYPLKLGNLWQYRDQNNRLSTLQINIEDTLLSNGQHYYGRGVPPNFATGYGFVRIDSSLRVQSYRPFLGDTCGGVNQELNIYRLNEPVGSVWPLCENIVATLCRPYFMRLEGIFTATIFGQPRQVMRFTPGAYCTETGDTSWYFVDWLLVKGIGIYREETIEFNFRYLTGAIINGVQYGTIVSVDDILLTQPNGFVLNQNYPNPFNPSTTIQYQIPERSHVHLTVHDVLGREVASVVEEMQSAGRYQVHFDAGNLASGVYMYMLRAGNSMISRRMIALN